MKDPGIAGLPTISSLNNAIPSPVTACANPGRRPEIPGVDVPYLFDGAFTVTVQSPTSAVFTLVRVQAKSDTPLAALASSHDDLDHRGSEFMAAT